MTGLAASTTTKATRRLSNLLQRYHFSFEKSGPECNHSRRVRSFVSSLARYLRREVQAIGLAWRDGVGGFGPYEGLGVIVVLVDSGPQVDDGSEDAAPEALAGEFGKEAFDGIEPGTGFRGEVAGPARVPSEPGFDLGVSVRGVVVDNGMDQVVDWDRTLDGIEEADELLMPVSLHAAADDLAVEHVEGGEQRRDAVALVIVRHRACPAALQRQAGLGAVERLDLMRWMAPSLHRRAVLVAVEGHHVGSHLMTMTHE
jgi:hypothetical protein